MASVGKDAWRWENGLEIYGFLEVHLGEEALGGATLIKV
jgi:hypothetical protein